MDTPFLILGSSNLVVFLTGIYSSHIHIEIMLTHIKCIYTSESEGGNLGFNYLWKDTDVIFLVAAASEDISHSEETEDKSNSSIFIESFKNSDVKDKKENTVELKSPQPHHFLSCTLCIFCSVMCTKMTSIYLLWYNNRNG